MTTARDLGTGPHKPFGSALRRGVSVSPITERPVRLQAINNGRCPECGSRFYGCGHDPEDDE